MRTLSLAILFCFFTSLVFADGEIWLPNISKYATGTKIGNTTGIDVNVAAGTITATNPSVGSTGAAVPSSGTYAAGNKAGSLTGLLIGQSTANSSLSVVLASDQSTISENVAQFGGSNVVTGTGASGVGIPRMTVSNDSNILATESGTWTVQPGNTANTSPWLMSINMGGTTALVTPGQALKVDASASTQPVSGTVAVTQSTSPWVNNITQFGGNNVVTGTGASGVGVPRFTISNDSSLAANQSVNLNQVGGSALLLGQQAIANSIPVNFSTAQVAPKTYSNSNATLSARQFVTNSETTLSAPANAVSVIVECESGNLDNLRWGFSNSAGSILSSTLGVLCEPGRSQGIDVGAGAVLHMISAGATTANDYMDVQWVQQ